MDKTYTIIVKETAKEADADHAIYALQKEITLQELKYLLSTIGMKKPE